MTRVGTAAQAQLLQYYLLDRQSTLTQTQNQVSSGYKATSFKGLARETPTLLSTKSLQAEIKRYHAEDTVLKQRLVQYDLTVGAFRSGVEALKQEVTGTIGRRNAGTLMQQVNGVFNQGLALLNSQIDGKYIFGGVRDDNTPLSFTNLQQLLALPTAASGFINSDIAHSQVIDQGFSLTYGILADTFGADFFESLRDIARINQGPLDSAGGTIEVNGGLSVGVTSLNLDSTSAILTGEVRAGDTITFAGDTTHTIYTVTATTLAAGNAITLSFSPPIQEAVLDNTAVSFGENFGTSLSLQQQKFLEGKLNEFSNALATIDNVQAQNGIRQRQLGDVLNRLEDRKIVLETLQSDLTDVDMTEAITRLNQDQTALQASLQVTAQVGRLSLLDYLR